MSVNTAVVAMTFSNTMKLAQKDNSSHNNLGTVGSVYLYETWCSVITLVKIKFESTWLNSTVKGGVHKKLT